MQSQQSQDAWNSGQATQQQGQSMQQGQSDEIKTLWIGDLVYWMDENYLWTLFATTGEVTSVKVIRNKLTGQSDGYGFVEFVTRAAAERFLIGYNGQLMPQSDTNFRLNWASFGLSERRQDVGPDHSVFVGDLAGDVNDYILLETFKTRYQSVKGAKVVTDVATNRSKGYGFVRFGSEEERDRALAEMNGEYCSSRPMRISLATPRRAPVAPVTTPRTAPPLGMQAGYLTPATMDGSEANNTTIFVGGLDPTTEEETLRATFAAFGELTYVKIPYGKGCGFAQFLHRPQAEEAIKALHGTVIGQQAVRLSWGRSPPPKQRLPAWGTDPASLAAASWSVQQAAALQPGQSQAYYGYGGYDPYASFTAAAQDPNAAAFYAAYYPQAAYSQPAQGFYPYASTGAYYPPNGAVPADVKERESFDPNAAPNVNRMNEVYIAQSEPGRAAHIWLKPNDQVGA